MKTPPRVIVSSIARVAEVEVQRVIRRLPVTVISLDESHVVLPGYELGYGDFLAYK